MDLANKVVALASRAANSNVVIDACLLTTFAALGIRSLNQQKDIEALEAEKESLAKTNKAVKKAIWDSKQQLFAEASSDSPLVPLANLKTIYGEAPSPRIGDATKEDAKSPASRFVI